MLKIQSGESRPIDLLCDNQGAIALAKDKKFHARMKHINLRHHFIREAVEEEKIKVTYISTEENVADIFMKVLARPKFVGFIEKLGLRDKEGKERTTKPQEEFIPNSTGGYCLNMHLNQSMWCDGHVDTPYRYIKHDHVSLEGELSFIFV